MAFRVIQQTLWTDEKVMDSYSCEDKYFWLYLLTNPQTNQLGIYKLPVKLAAFQLGYSNEQVIVLLDRFEKTLKQIKYNKRTQEISIGNFLYHSVIRGGKPVLDAIEKDISKVSDVTLFDFTIQKLSNKDITNQTVLSAIDKLKEKRSKKENLNANDNDNDNDNDDTYHDTYDDTQIDIDDFQSDKVKKPKKQKNAEPKESLIIQEIVEYLNLKANTAFRKSGAKTQYHIKARLNEGFSLEDFKTVIDKKTKEWINDPEMNQFLRPETLFGNKFEGYLNQKEKGQINARSSRDPIPDSGYEPFGEII